MKVMFHYFVNFWSFGDNVVLECYVESKNNSQTEESPETPPMKRRRRIIEELSSEAEDSDDEYVPGWCPWFMNFSKMFLSNWKKFLS